LPDSKESQLRIRHNKYTNKKQKKSSKKEDLMQLTVLDQRLKFSQQNIIDKKQQPVHCQFREKATHIIKDQFESTFNTT